MSRRRRDQHRDPVAQTAISPELGTIMWSMVGSFSDIEIEILSRRVGLEGPAEAINDIARSLGIPQKKAAQIEASVLSRLRHPSNSQRIYIFHDGEISRGALDRIREPLRRSSYHHSCKKHGDMYLFFDPNRHAYQRFCPACGCPVIQKKSGRPPEYCNQGCKQAAYRFRNKYGPLEPTHAQISLMEALHSAGHRRHYIARAVGVREDVINIYFDKKIMENGRERAREAAERFNEMTRTGRR